MKMRIVSVTETESQALCAAGKYQTGVPLFWVRDGKTWADAACEDVTARRDGNG